MIHRSLRSADWPTLLSGRRQRDRRENRVFRAVVDHVDRFRPVEGERDIERERDHRRTDATIGAMNGSDTATM